MLKAARNELARDICSTASLGLDLDTLQRSGASFMREALTSLLKSPLSASFYPLERTVADVRSTVDDREAG